MNTFDNIKTETVNRDLSEGFGDRLITFQENIGFGKHESTKAAECAGKTYVRYMGWRKSRTLPTRVQDISDFVFKACTKFQRHDILDNYLETVVWLCFGIDCFNPFETVSSPTLAYDESYSVDFVQSLEIYEDILKSRNLKSHKLSRKKKELAITQIIQSRHTEDGKTYKIDEQNKKFIGDILEL